MSESIQSQSAIVNGSVNIEPLDPNTNPNHKREADSETHNLAAKKSRTEAPSALDPSSGEEARNPEAVSGQQNVKEVVFEIEADAAEDKGSRHTMEDAWVVLLDASLDYPGQLRFFIIFPHSYCKLLC